MALILTLIGGVCILASLAVKAMKRVQEHQKDEISGETPF